MRIMMHGLLLLGQFPELLMNCIVHLLSASIMPLQFCLFRLDFIGWCHYSTRRAPSHAIAAALSLFTLVKKQMDLRCCHSWNSWTVDAPEPAIVAASNGLVDCSVCYIDFVISQFSCCYYKSDGFASRCRRGIGSVANVAERRPAKRPCFNNSSSKSRYPETKSSHRYPAWLLSSSAIVYLDLLRWTLYWSNYLRYYNSYYWVKYFGVEQYLMNRSHSKKWFWIRPGSDFGSLPMNWYFWSFIHLAFDWNLNC